MGKKPSKKIEPKGSTTKKGAKGAKSSELSGTVSKPKKKGGIKSFSQVIHNLGRALEDVGAFVLVWVIVFAIVVGISAADGYWNMYGTMALIKAMNPADINPWLNYWNLFNINLSYAVLYYYPTVWWTMTLILSGIIAVVASIIIIAMLLD